MIAANPHKLPGLAEPCAIPTQGQPPAERLVAGVRLTALVEIVAFLLIALAIDLLWGSSHRYAGVSPHPFWVVVLLASSYYGTREGLTAVMLASIALLLGNLPQQRVDEDVNGWLLRITQQPLIWCSAALVLGALKDASRRRFEMLQEAWAESQKQLHAITNSYERLHHLKEHLEARVAGHVCTVYAVYKASRAIDRQGVGEVLVGVSELVRTVMNPGKFSLFLLNGSCLEAVTNVGWQANDAFSRNIQAWSPLYEAVVMQRRFLVATDPAAETLLRGEGLLAGPLVNSETGAVVGMVKIEAIGFLDLNPSTVLNFRVLCEWVGAALANAKRYEGLQQSYCFDPVRRETPRDLFDRQRHMLVRLAQSTDFAASVLYLYLDLDPGTACGTTAAGAEFRLARAVASVAAKVLDETQLCCDYRCTGQSYEVLLPGACSDRATAIAEEFKTRLPPLLAVMGLDASIRIAIAQLGSYPP